MAERREVEEPASVKVAPAGWWEGGVTEGGGPAGGGPCAGGGGGG